LLVRQPDPVLKGLLTASNGVKVVVDKRREIWYDGNVKIHLDRVEGLGTFVEIEAIDSDGTYSEERLLEQCTQFMELFAVQPRDLIERSYSDLILELRS
jgi:adenylate cyclase, class 2